MNDTGIVNIRGKAYRTVALRVTEFREQCPAKYGWAITTEIIERNDELVVMKASIVNPEGLIVATGFAEEKRKGQINLTSALENCETSAIGRALAAFGLGGSEYASANEVENAIHQQSQPRGRRQPATKTTADEQAFFERARKGIERAKCQAELDAIKDLGREKQLSEKTKKQLNTIWIARQQFLKESQNAESLSAMAGGEPNTDASATQSGA